MIQVVAVANKKQLKDFIDLPHELYRDDSNYVPELFIAQRDLLSPGKHPFHDHSTLQLFLGYRNGKLAGRIAAIQNNNHNKFNNTNDGFFGFFDCADDKELATALFKEAEQWLTAKGANTVIGPVNFSTNETCGMLVKGYEQPPVLMMPYNKPYYNTLVEGVGFKKKTDLIAWQIIAEDFNDKPLRLLNALRERLL